MSNIVSHVWRPSSARSVTIDDFISVPRGSVGLQNIPLVWPAKDPEDVLDYQLSIEPALGLLIHRVNSRTFQDKSVVEIVSAIRFCRINYPGSGSATLPLFPSYGNA